VTRPRKVRQLVPKEHDEQVVFVRWFRMQFPGVRIFAIPNGGLRNVVVAKRLKDEGVESGVPDLYVPEWQLWIEKKRVNGRKPTPAQLDWHAYLRGIGHTVLVCKGALEGMAMVREFVRGRKVA
jgi:hypothetical protein